MEKYDVIIIGAGIAGCGLAYNLKKIGYKGKILIIDKTNLDTKKFSYRITFRDTVEEYNLPYETEYSSLKFHFSKKGIIELNVSSFLIDYNKLCTYLLKKSSLESRNEEALDIKKNSLVTNKSIYTFKYLIDCSGGSFFLRKLKKLKFPRKYWIGHSKIFKLSKNSDKKSLHYFFYEDGSFEDIYQSKNKLMYGYWKYVDKNNFGRMECPKESPAQKIIGKGKIIKEFSNRVPCSPALPLVYKNIVCLGDSFGNATTSSAEGIKPILNSSQILAYAIRKEDLKFYEKIWKKRYLNSYIKFLAFRMIRYPSSDFFKKIKKGILPNNSKIFNGFKKHPEALFNVLRNNSSFKTPKEIKQNFGIMSSILLVILYLNLKFKYKLM